MARVGDLTGQRFGKLVVLSFVGKDEYYDKIWSCKCDCGNIVNVRQGHLRSGHTASYGCDKPQLNDFTGRRFGSLAVIKRVEDYICPGNGKHYVKYQCKCDCGSVIDVLALNLKNKTTKSCGCQSPHAFEDLLGRHFGKLTVLKRVEDYVNPSGRKIIRYRCQCECGNQIITSATTLRNGEAESCGCIVNSRGEAYVREILVTKGIKCELHKTFNGCLSDEGNKLSYDFYLPEKRALIECNGIQHYEPVEFFGGDERFRKQQRHDFLKQQFAENNGYSYLVLDCRNPIAEKKNIQDKFSEFIDNLR